MTAAASAGTRAEPEPPLQVFRLPDLGEGLPEAEIVQWRVSAGDRVAADEVVVEVETAKAAVEVPCPYAGVVVTLHGAPGDRLAVGSPLLSVAPRPEPARSEEPSGREPGRSEEPSGRESGGAEQHAGSAARDAGQSGSGQVLVGFGTAAGATPRDYRRERRAARRPGADRPRAAEARATDLRGTDPRGTDPRPARPGGRAAVPCISPIVRRLAREHGVDLTGLAGSGPGGLIRRADVEAALAGSASAGTASAATAPAATASAARISAATAPVGTASAATTSAVRAAGPVEQAPLADERIPLRGVRAAVAERVSLSRREIPDVTVWVDVDATELLAVRAEVARAYPDRHVGLLAFLARICVHALTRFPDLNSRVETDPATGAREIVRLADVRLGLAAQTPRGLVVPVLHGAGRMSTLELAAAIDELTERAGAGTLAPADLTGGTFTLNNYGVFGVDGSTPIINHPEAALLGIGRVADKPWVHDGVLAVRSVAQLSLTFDHRVCDGAVAGGFLRLVADLVERPQLLLASL